MNLGFPEMIVLFAVALLVFGPKKLPELAKNLGKGIRDFKKAMSGEDEPASQSPSTPEPEPPKVSAPPAEEPTFAQNAPEKEPKKNS